MVTAPPRPADRCKAPGHQPFHIPNIEGIRLCATCWYLRQQERPYAYKP